MAGKIVLNGLKGFNYRNTIMFYFLDGVQVAKLKGAESVTIELDKDGVLTAKDAFGFKFANQLRIKNNMVTTVGVAPVKLRNGIVIESEIPMTEIDHTELRDLTFDPANFSGILFTNVEIGTNLLGWRKGVDTTSSLTPVCAKFTFINKTGKDIKYLTVDIRPYNAVGDSVECTVSGISLYSVKCTGPFENGQTYTQILENAWYNTTIETARIQGVTVVYMDGTEQVLSAEEFHVSKSSSILTDNESRNAKQSLGLLLMIAAGILDVISIFCIFSVSSAFSALTTISTIAFFVGLYLRK